MLSVLINFIAAWSVNVASAAKLYCKVALHVLYLWCGTWSYVITSLSHIALQSKFIQACGARINLAKSFTGIAAESYMRYTSDTKTPHAAFNGIAKT
jgi:hypothetical protein